MSIGDRISLTIKEIGISKKKFAESLNISPGNLSDWMNPIRKSNPTVKSLTLIYKLYNINLTWLIVGKGNMFEDKEEESTLKD